MAVSIMPTIKARGQSTIGGSIIVRHVLMWTWLRAMLAIWVLLWTWASNGFVRQKRKRRNQPCNLKYAGRSQTGAVARGSAASSLLVVKRLSIFPLASK